MFVDKDKQSINKYKFILQKFTPPFLQSARCAFVVTGFKLVGFYVN